jgi:hypothetical protein
MYFLKLNHTSEHHNQFFSVSDENYVVIIFADDLFDHLVCLISSTYSHVPNRLLKLLFAVDSRVVIPNIVVGNFAGVFYQDIGDYFPIIVKMANRTGVVKENGVLFCHHYVNYCI